MTNISATADGNTAEPGTLPVRDWTPQLSTGRLVLADCTVFEGMGFGATGNAVGEVCFNTAITGYQEILTDPSYAGQFITFTFPHIGNVGVNADDQEQLPAGEAFEGARGLLVRAPLTDPSNWRATAHLDAWLRARGIIGLYGIDTRALTAHIRRNGTPNATLAHAEDGAFNTKALHAEAAAWGGLEGRDLVPGVTSRGSSQWNQTSWTLDAGFGTREEDIVHVVAIDFGVKRNILRLLADRGCK
ncbi:MAG: carbamoyl phosphate synthase small subunit, partial [Devosiaceae bacterium]|nr:carbamoyl phosphate synthase small subunit [Devosiaceae bacterium MH13]